ncbi:D-glycero-beta-D-manno-heptose-7-phosphate kinase [Veillonella montpellierensis]|uniref:D-glycero-beta-D-manno-heptose-7-phosphate kinase n=1 Tax=Veillonella montpellierensis TaxID=187328 RepID=UPI0023F9F975|nr:D-glycero-beta-D-manno-heptose-7-phosphate kinase [Veillonella montpellierensis]
MINTTINEFLNHTLPNLKIAVIGDIMLDRYIYGNVNRISPEAPVPINKVSQIKEVLGGAANVASNLANLDCYVYLGGIAGDDDHGTMLQQLLAHENIDGNGILYSKSHSTTTKMRVLGNRQQMMRLDFETVQTSSLEEEEQLIQWLSALCRQGIDGIVVSDYGKGVCTPSLLNRIWALAKEHSIITIVDPKGSDWSKYEGATCITPNVKELSEVVGYELENTNTMIVKGATSILGNLDISYMIVTRSAEGITVVSQEGKVWHNPATQQEVFDVSGAGDTVVAMMITALAGNLSLRLALHVANGAAGIVVSKVGTYPIHRKELQELWHDLQKDKLLHTSVYSWETMKELIDHWQAQGDTVVFTNGCFDILHKGHISYLQEAATLGDHLIIGLNSDQSVRRLKGETRPIVSENDRAAVLQALGCIDGVVIFNEDTPAELLAELRPNILVKGGDYEVEDVIGREFVEDVRILSFKKGYSTSSIINRIATLAKENKL